MGQIKNIKLHIVTDIKKIKMPLGIYSLLESALLVVNAMAVLNEERFISKIAGWRASQTPGFGEEIDATQQILGDLILLARSIRTVCRIPLIAINIAVIVFKVTVG